MADDRASKAASINLNCTTIRSPLYRRREGYLNILIKVLSNLNFLVHFNPFQTELCKARLVNTDLAYLYPAEQQRLKAHTNPQREREIACFLLRISKTKEK